jgi:predicted nucleic acid-binding protein
MVLVDTSVWVDHLRVGNAGLGNLLNNSRVMCHPFIIGELACGNLTRRKEVIVLLTHLPQAVQARPEDALYFLDKHELMGKGLGYIDIHLLASAALAGVALWTMDKRLSATSRKLGLCYSG